MLSYATVCNILQFRASGPNTVKGAWGPILLRVILFRDEIGV